MVWQRRAKVLTGNQERDKDWMPSDLPGLYWDDQRNRYFPLSSKPKSTTTHKDQSNVSDNTGLKRARPHRKQRTLWNISESLRSSYTQQERWKSARFSELLATNIAQTSHLKLSRVPIFGKIKAFCTTVLNGETRQFLGDDRGWLYTCTTPDLERQFWSTELNIAPDSEVSSICISGSRCIATSFGPSARIFLQDLNTAGRTSLLTLNGVHDIWCADLRDQSLVLGGRKQAIYIANIDAAPPIGFPTPSDVLSVVQQQDLVYTGCRNGSIARFDMRVGHSHAQILLPERFVTKAASSVLHLNIVQHSQMIVSHMNGDLAAFDLRFPRHSTPLVTYPYHVNSWTRRLGIAVDPCERFLFAAGDDCHIRGWSLQTGQLLPGTLPQNPTSPNANGKRPSAGTEPDMNNPFRAIFSEPIEAMQVTDEGKLSLWVACGEQLYRYHLGMRA